MIALECPDCHRKTAPAPLYRHATTTRRRTCRGCHARWAITLKPLRHGRGVTITKATWSRIET